MSNDDGLRPEFDDADAQLADNALLHDLQALFNRHSRENRSNTPDFVLAAAALAGLHAFESATKDRDRWYDIHPEPGQPHHPRADVAPFPAVPNVVGLPEPDERGWFNIWSGKHDAWWRHNAWGYTNNPDDAGVFSYAETVRYVLQSAYHGVKERASVPVAVLRPRVAELIAERAKDGDRLDLSLSNAAAVVGLRVHGDHVDFAVTGSQGGPVALTPDEAIRIGRTLDAAGRVARIAEALAAGAFCPSDAARPLVVPEDTP